MEFTGEYTIRAARAEIWEALLDPEVLEACIPGVKSLEKRSDTEFTAVVAVKIGPVSARFKGDVTLSELDPPNSCRIDGQGAGGAAGFAKGGAAMQLAETDDGATLLTYKADVQVGGKLAQIGSRLIDGVARRLADDFFRAFCQRVGELEQPADDAEPAADTTSPKRRLHLFR